MKPKRPLNEEEPHAYTDEELKEHLADRQIKNVLERINAHNYDLLLTLFRWKDYLAGKTKTRPPDDLGQYLNPKMFKPVNDADSYVKSLIVQMKLNGEGRFPFVPVLAIAHNTCLTLVDRLGKFHFTPHIFQAEEAIRQIFYYARYNGAPTMPPETYDAMLDELCRKFLDACAANASSLQAYVYEETSRMKQPVIPCETSLQQIAANTKQIKQDVSGIREGRTGAEARLHSDPLSPAKRRQVNLVKQRYYERTQKNPNYSLRSVAREVWKEDKAKGNAGGYANDSSLNTRAALEIKREQSGQAPF